MDTWSWLFSLEEIIPVTQYLRRKQAALDAVDYAGRDAGLAKA